jgi:hypothetical protein
MIRKNLDGNWAVNTLDDHKHVNHIYHLEYKYYLPKSNSRYHDKVNL